MAKSNSANAKAPAKKTPAKGRSAVGARSRTTKASTYAKKQSPGKTTKPARKSSAPSRARGAAKKPAPKKQTIKQAAAALGAALASPSIPLAPPPPRGRGRPKDTPDVWTQEHIEEVAEQLWDYIESTPCPTEAEFCYKFLVAHQRLGDIPLLRQLKEFMFAKRQAFTIGKGIKLGQGQGPLGSFLAKLAANAGPFSMVEKSESTIHNPRPFSNLSDEDLEKIISDEFSRRSNG
jgi:hypothetical protein